MKKIYSIKLYLLFLLCLLCVNIAAHNGAYAEEYLVKGHYLVEGEIVEQKGNRVVIETADGSRKEYHRNDVQQTTEYARPEVVAPQTTKGSSFFGKAWDFIVEKTTNLTAFMRPQHTKFIRWFERTKFNKAIMNVEEIKNFRKNNKAGYVMSVYCVFLLLLAGALRLTQELIILVLHFFGIDIDRKR
ncbi:hypothetical protein ACFL3D_03130 [Candidatus Omnitrophota bacterium]